MWAHGAWEWFPLMWIFSQIFLVVMLVFLFRSGGLAMCGGRGIGDRDESAKEILDRRYARGEIVQEEYQRMKKDLE
ncbi:SHOCT domain-containing protein [Accumulibacter sp.]|uniref:SHOCT domain-containing protein n=1 Tax=Accumulibacter sp. TaxID=2053492 RepID=UPI0028C394DE|nr:SHOCT domain-containing protein [Accumulibacter sp.]